MKKVVITIIIIGLLLIINIPRIRMNIIVLHTKKIYNDDFKIGSSVKYFNNNKIVKLNNKNYDYDICAGTENGDYSDNLYHKNFEKQTKKFFDQLLIPYTKYELHYLSTCNIKYPKPDYKSLYKYLSDPVFYIEVPKEKYSKKLINSISKDLYDNNKIKYLDCFFVFVPEKYFGTFSKNSKCFWLETTSNKTCDGKIIKSKKLGYQKIIISKVKKDLGDVYINYEWDNSHEDNSEYNNSFKKNFLT